MTLKDWIKRETRRDAPSRWDYFKARVQQILRDACTKRLSQTEWKDLIANYPKLERLYMRQVITAKEVARLYREKKDGREVHAA